MTAESPRAPIGAAIETHRPRRARGRSGCERRFGRPEIRKPGGGGRETRSQVPRTALLAVDRRAPSGPERFPAASAPRREQQPAEVPEGKHGICEASDIARIFEI